MSWALHVVPFHVLGDEGLDYIRSTEPDTHGLNEVDTLVPRGLPSLREVLEILASFDARGESWFEVDGLATMPTCREGECATDVGEMSLTSSPRGERWEADDLVEGIAFRKPSNSDILLRTACVLSQSYGPILCFDHFITYFVVPERADADVLRPHWPWWSAELSRP